MKIGIIINREILPPEEHEAANTIQQNIYLLASSADGFRHTYNLYQHIRERRMMGIEEFKVPWTKIAGRNGAIEAYACKEIMASIAGINAPVIRSKMDHDKKDEANRLFVAEFPDISAVRNSTAHPELGAKPKEIEKHRAIGPASNSFLFIGDNNTMFVADSMHATEERLEFSSSFKKKLVSYELSEAKADALDEVARLYCAAFAPLGHVR